MKHVLVVSVLLTLFVLYSETSAGASEEFIVFCSDRDGDNEIYRMETDGSNVVHLTFDTHDEFGAMCSPDGSNIAFHKNRLGGVDIWTIDSGGGSPHNLTADAVADFMPDWSPDGSRIVYVSMQGGDFDLKTVNPDGSGSQNLTNNSGINDFSPSWCRVVLDESNNGGGTGTLAYCNQPVSAPDIHEIYTAIIDRAQNQKLIDAATGLNHHEWSPHGRSLAAIGYVDATTSSIYKFNADETGLTRLTSVAGVWDNEPSWSPDGTKFVWGRIYHAEGYRYKILDVDERRSDRGRDRGGE